MRKTALLVLNGALVVTVLTSTSSAALVLYEPFDYPSGQRVLGQSNSSTGTSWLLAAQSGTTDSTAINVASNSLTMPAPLQPTDGNSAAITGVGNLSGAANRLAFSPAGTPITSGTVYYSLALRVDSLSGSNNLNGGFFIGLNNTGNSATATNPGAVAARLQARIDPTDPNPTNPTRYNLGIFNNRSAPAASASWSTMPLNVGDTLFVVASYEINPAASNDVSRLWINPGSLGAAVAPAPTAVDLTFATTDINIASLLLRQSPAPFVTVDEIRVGTSWASVTAIPEPSPFFVLLAVSVLIAVSVKPWKLRGKCA
jgi:hypothetical protein